MPRDLLQASRALTFGAGRTVFRANDPAEAVYRVLSGEVHLQRYAPNGAIIVLQRARTGEFFAEASLFGKRYHCDAVCVQDCRCQRLPANAMRKVLRNDATFALVWIAAAARALRQQRAAQERLALKTTRDRVVHYLVDRGEDGRLTLDQPLIAWARELGVSHEALYRTLAAMEKAGVLTRHGATLALLPATRRI